MSFTMVPSEEKINLCTIIRTGWNTQEQRFSRSTVRALLPRKFTPPGLLAKIDQKKATKTLFFKEKATKKGTNFKLFEVLFFKNFLSEKKFFFNFF